MMTSCDVTCPSCVQLLSRRTEELEEARQEGKYQLQLLQSQNQQLETTGAMMCVILTTDYDKWCAGLLVAGLQRELEERRKIDSKSVQHQNHELQAEFDKKVSGHSNDLVDDILLLLFLLSVSYTRLSLTLRGRNLTKSRDMLNTFNRL